MGYGIGNSKCWHVIYTHSRAEKKVCQELTENNIECFLPLQKMLRKWKDRKKWVEMPLFPGYCFVYITRKEYDKVLQTNKVVAYITFEGKAAVVSNQQIEELKQLVQQSEFEYQVSTENFREGKKVEIIEGPLLGLKGELVRSSGKNKFIIRLHQLNNILMVQIPTSCLTYYT